MESILLLSYDFRPLRIIGWEKAIYLVIQGKAEAIDYYEKIIRSVSTEIVLPKVIRLKQYFRCKKKVRLIYRKSAVFSRDQLVCQYCSKKMGRSEATIDHVVPRAQGGPSTYENTVTSCSSCNAKKRDRTPKQAGMKLLNTPKPPEKELLQFQHEVEKMYESFIAELSV